MLLSLDFQWVPSFASAFSSVLLPVFQEHLPRLILTVLCEHLVTMLILYRLTSFALLWRALPLFYILRYSIVSIVKSPKLVFYSCLSLLHAECGITGMCQHAYFSWVLKIMTLQTGEMSYNLMFGAGIWVVHYDESRGCLESNKNIVTLASSGQLLSPDRAQTLLDTAVFLPCLQCYQHCCTETISSLVCNSVSAAVSQVGQSCPVAT